MTLRRGRDSRLGSGFALFFFAGIGVGCIGASPSLAQLSPREQDPDSILAFAHEAQSGVRSLRAQFSQRIENLLLERTRDGNGTWMQVGRDRFRMAFDEPVGDLYVADGECLWLYEPSLHDQIVVQPLVEGVEAGGVDMLGRLLAEARDAFRSEHVGMEEVTGQPVHHLVLTPLPSESRYESVDLWIDVNNGLVRRFRVHEQNETVRTVTLSSLEPNAQMARGNFEFVTPSGVPVFPEDSPCLRAGS